MSSEVARSTGPKILQVTSGKISCEEEVAVLRSGLLFLLLEEGEERHAGDLHDLEPDTRDVSYSMSLPTEPSDQHLVLRIQKYCPLAGRGIT